MMNSGGLKTEYGVKWKAIPNYYKQSRSELSGFIPVGDNSVLDIGCAAGYLGETLKKCGKAKIVFGIEGFKEAAREAEKRLDVVFLGDLETLDFSKLNSEWEGKLFDYLIFGDVLEHLRDPWSVLTASKCMLKDDGKILISLPNIRHWSVLLPLFIKGSWKYTAQGILDKTHFRFFTKSSACDMVEKSGLEITYAGIPVEGSRSKLLSNLSFGMLREFLGIQILISCKKSSK
ncbi:MAG: class I SAM-dependent methyltransferase [Porticoccaceae bacterium]|nr:class I SAM-dependent methyltransferase [Porticoccaceae bacterium]